MNEKADKTNPPSSTEIDRAYISLPKKIKEEYESYCQKKGSYTISGELRSGIMLWMEAKIEVRSDIDEDTLIKAIFKGKIVDLNDSYKTDFKLKDDLLHRFDDFWSQKGFESRSHALRMLMYHQILEWNNRNDISRKRGEAVKSPRMIEDEKKLNQELEGLKKKYGFCSELEAVVWIPDAKNNCEAKVIENRIYIYSSKYEMAEKMVKHEYWEYVIKKYFSKPYIDALNASLIAFGTFMKKIKDYLDNEVYKEQEKIIDTFFED